MEAELRRIIQNNKWILETVVDLKRIGDYLKDSMIFTTSMLTSIYNCTCDNFYDELCSRGPTAFQLFLVVLRKADYHEIADILEGQVPEDSNYLYYTMNSRPLGFCMIINNVNFYGKTSDRLGSDVDARNLRRIFERMGFEVLLERNLTAANMECCLKRFSQKPEFQRVHSSVVIILTHGQNINNCDVLYGVDLKPVYKSQIYSWFDNKCKHLRNKPKMFFFQACRGDMEDEGVEYDKNKIISNFNDSEETSDERSSLLPTLTDMFIVHSSLPYHVSYLHCEEGSFFCQDLVNVFSKYYHNKDLNALIVLVSKRMTTRVSEDKTKQAIHFEQIAPLNIVHFCRERELRE